MYSRISKVLVIAIGAMIAFASYAEEQCAVFKFVPGEIAGKASVLELAGSNGKSVLLTDKRSKGYKKVAKGEYDYYVEAGEHTIVLNQWKKDDYISHNKNIQRGRQIANPPQPVQRLLHLNAQANHAYRIGYSDKNGIYIESDQEQELACDNVALVEANTSNRVALSDKLPSELETQLMVTMSKVAQYQKDSNTNVFPIKENQYFGIVFDTSKGSSNGFLVKTILPNSVASTLNLKAGDYVTAMGEKEVSGDTQNPYRLLNTYVKNVPFSKELLFSVIRNGNKQTVSTIHKPVLVPESFYQINDDGGNKVYGQAALPKQLQFEFDQLLLALGAYYKQTKHTEDNLVVVERKKDTGVNFSLTMDLASRSDLHAYLMKIGKEGKMQNRNLRMAAERMGAVVGARTQYTGKDPISTAGSGR
ncbi:hypothetical protein tinsulaeT_22150 [Thalassotalea insulae]|uniref:PDZ domain-containing protein n=1 Tax=Thalassotalea insulae TaxID=2056778 RepID=A0ABQ6GW01_9GAMM|nr:hypothetical protein [Thalassotalea insulae]GLX78875.1 hypothetical protein tinsulaeT_22150 [Thalassotalea insulae]